MSIAAHQSEAVSRVIQGIASGIGFLGAGTILKLDQKQQIKGLTTASSIWLAAALGTAAGLGEYALATAAAFVSLFVLGVLGPIEKFLRSSIDMKRADNADELADAGDLDRPDRVTWNMNASSSPTNDAERVDYGKSR